MFLQGGELAVVIRPMKFTRKKAVLILLAAAVLLLAIIFIIGDSPKTVSGSVKTNEDRVAYLRNLGWEIEAEPIEEQEAVIPGTFDGIYAEYNKLQIQQGFDLSGHCGKQVLIYTYKVTNYPVECDVLAVIYLLNGKVIAGDIHSASVDGFMHGLT